ncbi:NAD(P)H-hydrate dehydratase [Hydrogenophaga sp. XSHU_21]
MRRIEPSRRERLFNAAATRAIESALAARRPPHALMARAGEGTARLALALYPHARRIWVACGPGNNGGDGLVAAMQLQRSAPPGWREVVVTLDGDPGRLPADAAWALSQAAAASVHIATEPPQDPALMIDALLGLGGRADAGGPLARRVAAIHGGTAPVLSVDLPSGLNPDTGAWPWPIAPGPGPRHCLSLLTLKPGLVTAQGRDMAGDLWLDDLGADDLPDAGPSPTALAGGFPLEGDAKHRAAHAGHKGRYGDVAVVGGQLPSAAHPGMVGAAVLAARGALQGGAGRVYLGWVGDGAAPSLDPVCPEIMVRTPAALLDAAAHQPMVVVAGCGGGESVREHLPTCLQRASHLVLDADGLNAVAQDPALQSLLRRRASRGLPGVLTPHPLEAARLLGTDTASVMADRVGSAMQLAETFQCVVVLKGSGSVVCGPGQTPWINLTGNARLATAGTGDVLAGLIGAALARDDRDAFTAACAAVAHHGALADAWPGDRALTAAALAAAARAF